MSAWTQGQQHGRYLRQRKQLQAICGQQAWEHDVVVAAVAAAVGVSVVVAACFDVAVVAWPAAAGLTLASGRWPLESVHLLAQGQEQTWSCCHNPATKV